VLCHRPDQTFSNIKKGCSSDGDVFKEARKI
jgi:hypothetical protein